VVGWDASDTPDEGHAVRIMPMEPELRPILQMLFDQAREGSGAVVPRPTESTTNLRTTFMKLIARAGYEPDDEAWAAPLPQHARQLRHRLGPSWSMALPAHVVAHDPTVWPGHSPPVAAKHDLQTLMRLADAHFEVAIRGMPRVGEAEAQAAPHPRKGLNARGFRYR
jgi:hypothetical protein